MNPEPDEAKAQLVDELMTFPVTDFHANGDYHHAGFARRLEWMQENGARTVFPAGGAGEFFSLTLHEYRKIIDCSVGVFGRGAVFAGAGGSTAQAVECAQIAERAGAAGILLLPPYLAEASGEGLVAHVAAVCDATSLGAIVYHRANARYSVDVLERLAERCANLIGFKDGTGDIEGLMAIKSALSDRLVYINGMATAELYAPAYFGMGVRSYSSAIFNFMPQDARAYFDAVHAQNVIVQQHFLDQFLLPYVAVRRRSPGYAVSIIKAALAVTGRSAGPVRPPLNDLSDRDREDLRRAIDSYGEWKLRNAPRSGDA